VDQVIDGCSPKLYWQHPKLGVFDPGKGNLDIINYYTELSLSLFS
jgi:hypothetical protein